MKDGEDPRLIGRNGFIFREHVAGRTYDFLSKKYGISISRAQQICEQVRATIPSADRAEMVKHSIEFLKTLQAEAYDLIELAGAPVAVGKDGIVLRDPETGEIVRDYSARLKAIEVGAKMDDMVAKRLGLDSPSRVESSSTVLYRLEGVNTEDLT